MGQILSNIISVDPNVSEHIKTHIPFEENLQEYLTWSQLMSYLDVEQKFKYREITKNNDDECIIVENLKTLKVILGQPPYRYCRGGPRQFKTYESIQYYFEKNETPEITESINSMINDKEPTRFKLI